ncbi:MAG: hypothetical protein E7635_04405 [Ruminococcaceae bacterium]|nr:hypothetical protein [Oscillospiraceae bacterium]
MKKILCVMLAMIMCLSSISVAASTSNNVPMDIIVDQTQVEYGETEVIVNISISNNPGIAIVGFNVNYDNTAMTLESATLGSIFTGDLECNIAAVPFVFNVYTGSANKVGNGKLVTLKFKLKENCEAKTYGVTIDNVEALNIDEEELLYKVTNGSVKVNAKSFDGLSFNNATYTYDGTEKSIIVNGVPSGATVTYTSNDTSENKATNAGTYNITATVQKAGFNDWTATKTLIIKPKALSVSGLAAPNKTYDSTTSAVVSGGTLVGKVDGDDVSISGGFPTSGNFASANVGNNIAVNIAQLTLDGADKNNYKLTQPIMLKANITPAPISVKADDITIIKGELIPELTYKITSGKLYGSDAFSGKLATTANGSTIGNFDITKGTLSAGANYSVNFTKGTLSVVDKTPQNITVSEITSKTYGDTSFVVTVTPDLTSGLSQFTYESSNPAVAEIAADGTVTIKAAGETNITVRESGNEDYAPFTKTQKLTVNKVKITVTADAKTKKVGTSDPALTYIYTGELVGEDAFTGGLVRASGESVGKYDIKIGTLKINNNYDITYNKAIFEIVNKTPQDIVVTGISDKVYGDAPFAVSVTPDLASGLSEFTFESSNTDVAEIAADGTVTIKAAGQTVITVRQAGNDDYAPFVKTQKLNVGKKPVTIASVDIEGQTAELDGVIAADTAVEISFDDAVYEIVEENAGIATVRVEKLALTGEGAENYTLVSDTALANAARDIFVKVVLSGENGVLSGAGVYLKNSDVTINANASGKYDFVGWYEGEELVSSLSRYTFTAEHDIELTAKFEERESSGGALSSYFIVRFNTDSGSKIDNQMVKRGSRINEPEAPVKEGYVFEGWFIDPELTEEFDFDTKIKKNTTLYAKWSELEKEPEDDKSEDEKEPETTEWQNPFDDVNVSDWFYASVQYAAENKLMNGVSEDKFAPNDTLTRAMLVTVLYRNAGEPSVNKSIPFSDVDMGAYYASAVIWAKQNGIVNGVSETEFAPDANITREQIAAIMYRYAQYKGYDVSVGENTNILSYDDVEDVSEYAVASMQYVVGSGLIKGKTETTLNPKDNATRAEIATVLQRFIEMNN